MQPKRGKIFLPNERVFIDEKNNVVDFESFTNKPTKYLSVVVPAYNEEERLSIMLDEAFEYLIKRSKKDKKFSFEIILVSDGSKDNTVKVASRYLKQYGTDQMRILDLHANVGKGGAVRRGVLCARGEIVLMADADGASKFSDFELLEKKYKSFNQPNKNEFIGIVCGSRAHLKDDAVAKRSWLRNLLMYGFHAIVMIIGGIRAVQDTQCGFKLFGRTSAWHVFSNLHIERWAFDLELLYVALRYYNTPVGEVAINWHEVDGSKLSVVNASLQMARDVLRIRLCYEFGIWDVTNEDNDE